MARDETQAPVATAADLPRLFAGITEIELQDALASYGRAVAQGKLGMSRVNAEIHAFVAGRGLRGIEADRAQDKMRHSVFVAAHEASKAIVHG